MTGEFLFEPVPDEGAASFIKDKPAVTRRVFNRILPELRARAFTISGIESLAVLQAVRDEIAQLPEGGDWDEIKKNIVGRIHPFLADPENPDDSRKAERRAELLLRTHGFQANQAAAYRAQADDEEVYPYVQYATAEDDRVRPNHAALEGVMMPFRSEFVQSHWCPWAWGCRCQWIPVTDDDAAEVRESDARRSPEEMMLFEGSALDRLQSTRTLTRGPNKIFDLRNDRERGNEGGFYWSPEDLRIPLEELRRRYSSVPGVFDKFEKWARKEALPEQKLTVWEWLEGQTLVDETAEVEIEPQVESFAELEPRLRQILDKHGPAIANAKKAVQAKFLGGVFGNPAGKAELAKALQRRQDEMLAALVLPEDVRTAVKLEHAGALKTEEREGMEFVRSLTHRDVFAGDPVQVKRQATRAHADAHGRYINGKSMDASTVAHELCHIIEARDPKVLKRSLDFLDSRTPGEVPRWMGSPYGRREVAKEDQWVKLGGDLYSGKHYEHLGRRYATEILSMGIQRIWRDAGEFMESDPTYFAYVVDALRGK